MYKLSCFPRTIYKLLNYDTIFNIKYTSFIKGGNIY
ncbi:hypothetical protein CNEO2_490015 [Clostridium neonatale]|nr:hypothetical protein CNEO2_490015 [Clostridium neonatale]